MTRVYRGVEHYAPLLCITPKYLSECCMKESGHNATYYIDRFTVEEITGMLKDETLTLTDIANRLHFNSMSYFNRYCKRILGITPGEYRSSVVG